MNKRIEIIDPLKTDSWNPFVEQHEYGNIYHTSYWADIIGSTFKYKPLFYTLLNGQDILAAIPLFYINSRFTGKRFVSVPFADYSDILCREKTDIEELMSLILKDYKNYLCNYIEFRTIKSTPLFDNDNFQQSLDNLNHDLNLVPPLEEIRKKFHKNHILRSIKKAESFNLKFIEVNAESDFNQFYKLNMKTRVMKGLPPLPFHFLRHIWRKLKAANAIKIFLVYYGDIAIAGIMMASFNKTAYYLYSGSEKDHLDKRPNHFMLWNAIKLAKEEGNLNFDFGRSSTQNKGLVEFKNYWGTEQNTISTFWYSNFSTQLINRSESSKGSFSNKIIKNSPFELLKLLSKLVYKHLG